MIKKIFKNLQGLTLIEIIIAVFIVGVITTIFAFSIRTDEDQKLDLAADQLASDIRFARNLAVSRTATDFGDGNGLVYPAGGYVMEFWGESKFYFIYADNGRTGPGYHYIDTGNGVDKKIKKVFLPDSNWWLGDASKAPVDDQFVRITFLTESKITTTLLASSTNSAFGYAVQIINPKGGLYPATAYMQSIKVAEDKNDGTMVTNIGSPTPGAVKWPKYPNNPQENIPVGMGGPK